MKDRMAKHELKGQLKRRTILLCLTIPFGAGFAVLVHILKLSSGLQLFLTMVCWAACYCLIELIYFLFKKFRQPKKEKIDPFGDIKG